jgi:gliding motility-associated lipoprotein GldD
MAAPTICHFSVSLSAQKHYLLMKTKTLFSSVILLTIGLFATGCGEDDEIFTPKPKAYMRIDFPKKSYRLYDSICPFTFETPVYSVVEYDKDPGSQPCWINVKYPQFRAQLHVSYLPLFNNLDTLLMNSRDLAVKHQVKASGMDEQVVIRDSAHVYGLVYDISGNTASSLQFYLTDSTKHFFRGSLYFDVAPNIDSTKIVIDFLKKDIFRMIQSFKWKDYGKISIKK